MKPCLKRWAEFELILSCIFNKYDFSEKYDVRIPGCRGSGGYYETVLGFGWTNGVILDFFQKYGDRLVAPVVPENLQCGDVTNAQSQLIPVNGVYLIAQFFHIVTYFIYRLI